MVDRIFLSLLKKFLEVDESYDCMFSNIMPREVYYQINKKACIKLRELEG